MTKYNYIITPGFLKNLDKNKPSLFFDIDHTIIYPYGKKKMYSPYNNFRWTPDPHAKADLKRASKGFTIYFVTNQLKYDLNVEKRIYEMLSYLDIDALVLIATERNEYRKPSPKIINNPYIPGGIPTIDPRLSFHCGDAAGRSADFSDDDLWFAKSAGLNFFLPEEIFGVNFDFFKKRLPPITAKSPDIDTNLIMTLTKFYDEADGIMLIGLPGVGKTTLRNWMVNNLKAKKNIIVYSDEKEYLENSFYIFDNTNLNAKVRSLYPEWVKRLNIKTIFIDLEVKDAIRGVKYRNLFEGGKYIPEVTIYAMNKKIELLIEIDLWLKARPRLNTFQPEYLN